MSDIELAMSIIAEAGECKSLSMEAIRCAREGDFGGAAERMGEGGKALARAHSLQTDQIRKEMTGEGRAELSLLMVHAQDHIMGAVTARDFAFEIIELYKRLAPGPAAQEGSDSVRC
jgi:PTS system cellobiose-specific IIA component